MDNLPVGDPLNALAEMNLSGDEKLTPGNHQLREKMAPIFRYCNVVQCYPVRVIEDLCTLEMDLD